MKPTFILFTCSETDDSNCRLRLRSCDVHGAPDTAIIWWGHDWVRVHWG